MKKPGYWVKRWLDARHTEGPIEPYDAYELVEAFVWDREYRRAHALADALLKSYQHRRVDDMKYGELLGMRSVLFAVAAADDLRRAKRASRAPRRAANERAADRADGASL